MGGREWRKYLVFCELSLANPAESEPRGKEQASVLLVRARWIKGGNREAEDSEQCLTVREPDSEGGGVEV